MIGGRLALAVALALSGALAFAVATVAQQRAAARSSDLEARGRGFVVQLLRRPQWWAGTMGNGAGYVLQALALGFGSLLVVQPIMVTSLLFALPLGASLAHRRLTGSVWMWVWPWPRRSRCLCRSDTRIAARATRHGRAG